MQMPGGADTVAEMPADRLVIISSFSTKAVGNSVEDYAVRYEPQRKPLAAITLVKK